MDVELRKLSVDDGLDIYEMLQELPQAENGFTNACFGKSFDEYKKWLKWSDNASMGIGLEEWMVPQNIYWLYVDGVPAGMGKLRHSLTDALREEGGHCGYLIRASYRGKGLAKELLELMLDEAKAIGIDKLLITAYNENTASIKVALACGGELEKVNDRNHFVWIDLM